MKYTWRVWILYAIVLFLYCLMAEEGAKAAKKHFIINAAGLIQHIYFENAHISNFKSKGMLLWRRGFVFVSTGNERLRIHSELRKIRFEQERTPAKTLNGQMSEFYIQNRFKTAA